MEPIIFFIFVGKYLRMIISEINNILFKIFKETSHLIVIGQYGHMIINTILFY